MSYYKGKNFIKKFCKHCGLKTSSRPLCLQRIKHNLYWKKKFSKQALNIRSVIAKLLKFVQIIMQTSSGSFSQRILWKLKGPGTSSKVTFFIDFFDNFFSFVLFHDWPNFITKLCLFPKLFNKTCFVIHCLGNWWRHVIWISEKLKFDYLKNEKSFRSEIKNIFLCFKNALL